LVTVTSHLLFLKVIWNFFGSEVIEHNLFNFWSLVLHIYFFFKVIWNFFGSEVHYFTCSHFTFMKLISMKMQSIYRRKLFFFFINQLFLQFNCNNKYYQLQMNTFCMQSVCIPVTNIISFSIIWYDTYILNEAWFSTRIPYVSQTFWERTFSSN